MDEDEYVFQSTLETGSGKEADAFNKIAKKALADKLRKKFQAFPAVRLVGGHPSTDPNAALTSGLSQAIIEAHGKDLLADDGADDSAPASGASTPSGPTDRRRCGRLF